MRNLNLILFSVVVMTVLVAPPAGAIIRDEPARMLLVDPPVELTPGESHVMTVVFMAFRDVTIHDVKVNGTSWTVKPLNTGEPRRVFAKEELRLEFDVNSSSPNDNLEIEYSIDGVVHRFIHDPMSDHHRPMEAIRKGDTPARTKLSSSMVTGEPSPPTPPLDQQNPGYEITKMDSDSAKATYRVTGQIKYPRTRYSSGTDNNFFIDVGVDGATVRVFDKDTHIDWELASGVTDEDGFFDITFTWNNFYDPDPDLFLRYEAGGPSATVSHLASQDPYYWESAIHYNYIGPTLDFGQLWSMDNAEAMHILTSITRAQRWFVATSGINMTTGIRVFWPNDVDGAYYTTPGNSIFIGPDHSWNESTHVHEYGHHLANLYVGANAIDYCNGYCDDGGCGHCWWCEEDAVIAWTEGFANWVSETATRDWEGQYQWPPLIVYNSELARECYVDGTSEGYHNSYITEGFFQSFLRDLDDSENENDSRYLSCSDATDFSVAQVWDVHFGGDYPLTPYGFIMKFMNAHPNDAADIWETATNNGYFGLDTMQPITPFLSSTHNETPQPDSTIRVSFDPGWDDLSGIAGYSYIFSSNSAVAPSTTTYQMESYSNGYLSSHQSPGSYYFTLRAFDRAGNADDDYRTIGPLVVAAVDPGDLEPYADSLWDYPAVPRSADDVDMEINAPTSVLSRDNTYWNINIRNTGDENIPSGTRTAVMVDGLAKDMNMTGIVYAGYGYPIVNQGPISMMGGRHTFGAMADYYEAVGEPNEADNAWSKQWVWNPILFYGSTEMDRPHPPIHDGGWDSIYSGTVYYNSDGLRFLASNTGGLIAAVNIIADNPQKNFDIRMHDLPTSAVSGFESNLGFSTRPARFTDAVIVNCENRPRAAYDVGVVNLGEFSDEGYHATVHYAENLTLDIPLAKAFTSSQAMDLFKFEITAANQGPQSLQLAIDVFWGDQPVYLAWYDETFTTGTLLQYTEVAITGETGYVQIDIDAQPGLHTLVVWRDQFDGTFAARDYTITVGQPPADLVAYQPYGWDAPIIPRPALDASGSYAPVPTSLPGDQASTYLNYAYANESLGDAGGFYVSAHIDGMMYNGNSNSSLPAGSWSFQNRTNALTVSGGRHAVRLMVDYSEDIFELIESNNHYGSQYVWTPTQLVLGTALFRAEPPEPTSDWQYMTSGTQIWSTCDGVRTPQFQPSGDTGYWGVVATNPTNYSDVDLRLHEVSTGADNGFAEILVRSSWPPESTDFVIVNFNLTSPRAFDAGVIATPQSRDEDYKIVASESSYHGNSPNGTFGPFSMTADELVALHEFNLDAGTEYVVVLTPVNPSHNVGLSFYGPDLAYYSKSDVFEDGIHDPAMDWDYDPASTREITFTTDAGGYNCIAIWKARIADSELTIDYSLSVNPTVLSAVSEEEIPVRTQLSSLYPNPFNPQTRVVYEIAAPENVRLCIYDLTGRLVRKLVEGHQGIGRYEMIWDGRNNNGHTLASGTYVVRLEAGNHVQAMRATLLK